MGTKNTRVQLDLNEDAMNQLDSVVEASGQPSRAGAIRSALSVYEWYLETTKGGSTIVVEHKNGEKERVRLIG